MQATITKSLEWKTSLLSVGFTGDLVTPNDPQYEASLIRFAKNAQKQAGLVAFVKSSEDVSKVIKFVTGNGIEVVIRGGGHSTSGSSSTEGGIVIDLSRHLNSVRIDEENKLGCVGGGATWAKVDAEAIKYDLAAVAGTVNHTGVGGLSLGGGYGFLTSEHGLVIDNIVQVTLVTPDGDIRTINEESNPDLFWAIRGGGCNFGCVTEFVYRLHPQRKTVFAGPLVFPPPMLPRVVTALEEWYHAISPKEAVVTVTTNAGRSGGPEVVVILFYNGEEAEGRQKFKKLLDIGPVVDLASMIPYEQVNSLQNASVNYGGNCIVTGLTRDALSPEAAEKIFHKVNEVANVPSSVIGKPVIGMLWEYHDLRKLASVAPDTTAYRMRTTNLISPLFVTWEGDGPEALAEAQERVTRVRIFSEELLLEGRKKEKDETGCGNYGVGRPTTSTDSEALFGENYHRLQQIKKKYDPNVVFSSWYPIVPSD